MSKRTYIAAQRKAEAAAEHAREVNRLRQRRYRERKRRSEELTAEVNVVLGLPDDAYVPLDELSEAEAIEVGRLMSKFGWTREVALMWVLSAPDLHLSAFPEAGSRDPFDQAEADAFAAEEVRVMAVLAAAAP